MNGTLPQLEPFEKAGDRIACSEWLTPDDRDYLAGELARLQGEYTRLDFALPPSVIHGDASIGNVLHDESGNLACVPVAGGCRLPRRNIVPLPATASRVAPGT
jgi:hypothetical protein